MNLDVRDDSESVAMGYYIARGEERRGEEESRAVSDNGERSNEEVRVFTDDENGGGTRNYEINYSCVVRTACAAPFPFFREKKNLEQFYISFLNHNF
mmetsp:Transcript_26182/g.60192  ORF Transcript_26182/g.60192 Transcript_26182/m.60192 type:complete len:97 (+) Transcript_26182:181-471(+)